MFNDAAANVMESINLARGRFDAAKDKLEATKERLNRYSFKRVKAFAAALLIINAVVLAAALTISIIALVKSIKASKKADCFEAIDDYENYDDDSEDYDFTLKDNEIPSPVKENEDGELSF